jgi:solute:Na+ symporter, SSS family
MNAVDYVVLIGTMLSIVGYGIWQTRQRQNLHSYLHGDRTIRWGTIGLSVMATQASAITFLSTPGQGYDAGLKFVQIYFGMPLALVIIAAVFLPLYRKLDVDTAYEFLGRRFDAKTRLLGAGLFLLHRGLAAGITIYAPAIIVSRVLGWPLDLTIVITGLSVIVYTVSGGTKAVSLTQRYQMAVILCGMVAAFIVLVVKMPASVSVPDMLHLAGSFGKLETVDFSFDLTERYTLWSGLLSGLFLSLSYFGTDQSQVQRYLAGTSVRDSRLGLMFNAVLKIPMQFSILLLGALVFVFFQFERPPLFFNQTEWRLQLDGPAGPALQGLEADFATIHTEKQARIATWLDARHRGDPAAAEAARAEMLAMHQQSEAVREQMRATLTAANPRAKTKDTDYVFITFVLDHLPHGLIGLFLAVVFAAAFSSTASELNALGSTTSVDFYKHLVRPEASDSHHVAASRWFTAMWGGIAVGFAFFLKLAENLIEAINIVGSLFYGVLLGLFLVAFFFKRVGGTAIFAAALATQICVFIGYFTLPIGYLWYNIIGCVVCVTLSLIWHQVLGPRDHTTVLPPP